MRSMKQQSNELARGQARRRTREERSRERSLNNSEETPLKGSEDVISVQRIYSGRVCRRCEGEVGDLKQ